MPDLPPPAPSRPHHQTTVRGRVGSLNLQFEATLSAPWTVLFGPSGCGKSSVLRALCGLTPGLSISFQRIYPDGSTQALDHLVTRLPPERRCLAYSPQQAVLLPHLTVEQNVAFAAEVRRPHTLRHRNLVRDALELLRLGPLADRRPQTLSGGERQRVSVARALAVPDAQLVLLDEAFTGIDRTLRNDLLPRIAALLAERGIPVLSVTHDLDEVLLLQPEVLRMAQGHVTAQGPARSVLAPDLQQLRALLQSSDEAFPLACTEKSSPA